jgi:hypothetical protein
VKKVPSVVLLLEQLLLAVDDARVRTGKSSSPTAASTSCMPGM